ncbi:MAG: putative metal-dependent hydrolase, TIM-barrel fold [Chloroflexi bacterium]|jgi:predicted TIM-barrel fold metal-dependent hydrolase|nr:MAG: putative metal-dependent hydrolase, TIM-barrel fold [Chloroflexota bacterium]
MLTIDADAHVVENEHTWDYMDPSDSHLRPYVVAPESPEHGGGRFWLIDGKVRGLRQVINDAKMAELKKNTGRDVETSKATRQMENIGARIQHMDDLGIDIQVLQPTIFLEQIADRAEVEVALCKAYNRWLADIWSQAPDRLRWVAVLPMLAMTEALKELRIAIQNGACGVLMRSLETDKTLLDPYFFPLYEEVSRLNIPMIVHVGNASASMVDFYRRDLGLSRSGFVVFRLQTVGAFHSLIISELPDQFPSLRFGFLEASAQWVPFAIHDLRRRMLGRLGATLSDNIMKDNRIWVACETNDDLPYVLKYAGEDNLVIGTDYGHADQSTEIEALRTLKEQEDIDPAVIDKILSDNPKALYNL